MADALKRPFLLPKDMEALKNVRQQELFMSLKRDLVLVRFLTHFTFMLVCLLLI